MTAVRAVRWWFSEELRYSRMGVGLGCIAADLRSRLLIVVLSAPIVAQLRIRTGARAVDAASGGLPS
jgi:hypothetical protein